MVILSLSSKRKTQFCLEKRHNMKKILTVLLVLVVACGLFAASETKASDSLKLNYLKSTAAAYGLGWYSDATVETETASENFNKNDGTSKNIVAYLKAVKNYSASVVNIKITAPTLTNEVDATTIAYTATITNMTADALSDVAATIASSTSPTATAIATMPAKLTASLLGILKFEFIPVAADISAATANVAYDADVTVTMETV